MGITTQRQNDAHWLSPDCFQLTYLEDLGEEARADLLAEEVVDASQTGHGAPQGSVGGRADAVGRVDAVERRLVRTAVTLLRVAEAALRVVVHGAAGPPRSRRFVWLPQEETFTPVCVRPVESWDTG